LSSPAQFMQTLETPIKLNLGGAGEGYLNGRIPGFLTVDLREGEGTDIVSNANDLSQFANGTVDEVYASNILEHFPIPKTLDVLKEWCRVLKSKGKLYVSVPDFDHIVKLYLKAGYTEWLNFHLFGDQKHDLNYHYTCFTFATLAKALIDAGFSDVKRVKLFDLANDGSTNIDSLTGEFISLNMVAYK
jgi:predicted SAM-dependent methyltransferase